MQINQLKYLRIMEQIQKVDNIYYLEIGQSMLS
jgi:hypothetical protein